MSVNHGRDAIGKDGAERGYRLTHRVRIQKTDRHVGALERSEPRTPTRARRQDSLHH